MNITTRRLGKNELHLVRQVADMVWPVTFREILSEEQIAYMMEMMYAKEVMEREFDDGIRFNGMFDDDRPVGYYIWGRCKDTPCAAKLHKCYLLTEYQGKGLGSRMLRETKAQAAAAGYSALRLNVNRHNEKAMRAYFRNGFSCVQMVDNPIGNGFYMNDFVMEAKLDALAVQQNKCDSSGDESRRHAVLACLAEDFDYVCYMNYQTSDFIRFRASAPFLRAVSEIDQRLPIRERLNRVFAKLVHPDDLAMFIERIAKDRVLSELSDKPVYKFEVRLLYDGLPKFFRVKFVHDQKNSNAVVVGLLDIDAQVKAEILQGEEEARQESMNELKELNRELVAANAFSDLFIGTYIYAYYVNLATDSMTVYHKSGRLADKYSEISGFRDFIEKYIGQDVHPDDRRAMRELLDVQTIRRLMVSEKEYSVYISSREAMTTTLPLVSPTLTGSTATSRTRSAR